MKKGNNAAILFSIVLGIVSIIAPFTFFLAALSFLSIIGLVLAVSSRKKEKTPLNKIALIVNSIGVSILVIYVVVLNFSDFRSSNTIYEYYIPKNYTGWVFIHVNTKDARPVKIIPGFIGGRYIILIPPSGKIETSSSLNDSHHTKYFWYTEKDTVEFKNDPTDWEDTTFKPVIHCEGYAGLNDTDGYDHFFVADKPRNPQDTVIIKACETLFDKLKEFK